MGRVRLCSERDFPSGGEDGIGVLERGHVDRPDAFELAHPGELALGEVAAAASQPRDVAAQELLKGGPEALMDAILVP
jgi:hypothetical protein